MGYRTYLPVRGEQKMTVSRDSGHSQRASFWETVFGQLSRYDLLLAAIPLALAVPLALYTMAAVPFYAAVALGSVFSVLFVADALFFHPPTDAPS